MIRCDLWDLVASARLDVCVLVISKVPESRIVLNHTLL